MFNKNKRIVATLATMAACAVAVAALGNVKHPVTKPEKVHATATWVVSLTDGSATVQQIGEGTHFGRFIVEGTGTWDLDTMTITSASGTATDVNGDQLFWVEPGPDYEVQFIGGTGRANVTGGFNPVWMSEPEITAGPVPGTMAITISYVGEGTVTY